MDLTICGEYNSAAYEYAEANGFGFELSAERDYSQCVVGYYIEDGKAYITDCDPTAVSVEIPETLEDAPVVAIQQYAFRGCVMESVVIPETVTGIGKGAFSGCESLKEIELPGELTRIGDNAFAGCTALESIVFPAAVSSIGKDVMKDCTGLIRADLSGLAITDIPDNMFQGCTGLKQIAFPEKLATVGNGAFRGCTGLEEVTFPNNRIRFEDCCFYGCSSLKDVTFPEQYCYFDYLSFVNCPELKDITIDGSCGFYYNSVGYTYDESTGDQAPIAGVRFHIPFNSGVQSYVTNRDSFILVPTDGVTYTVLEDETVRIDKVTDTSPSIVVPARIEGMPVSTIGVRAFKGMSKITTISLPNTLTSIENYAFMNCSSLNTCGVPSLVSHIGSNAFYNTRLASNWKSSEFVVLGDGVLYQYNGSDQEVTLPNRVKVIGEGVFAYQNHLQKIQFNEALTEIGDGAFLYCESLTSIELPDSVTRVGNAAFSGCTSLKRFTCGTGLALIDEYAFFDCTIELFRGETDSYAQSFATEHGYTFEIIAKAEPEAPAETA